MNGSNISVRLLEQFTRDRTDFTPGCKIQAIKRGLKTTRRKNVIQTVLRVLRILRILSGGVCARARGPLSHILCLPVERIRKTCKMRQHYPGCSPPSGDLDFTPQRKTGVKPV